MFKKPAKIITLETDRSAFILVYDSF